MHSIRVEVEHCTAEFTCARREADAGRTERKGWLGWVETTNQNNSLLQHAWFQQKMLMEVCDPKDDQRYGMVEAISHLVHRDYAEIGHLVWNSWDGWGFHQW